MFFFLVSVEVYCVNSKHTRNTSTTYTESAFQHQKIEHQKTENKLKSLSEKPKFAHSRKSLQFCNKKLDVLIQNICRSVVQKIGRRRLYQESRRRKSNNQAEYTKAMNRISGSCCSETNCDSGEIKYYCRHSKIFRDKAFEKHRVGYARRRG